MMIQTQQAGELLPSPDLQKVYPGFTHPSTEDVLDMKRVGRLAGYGILTEKPAPIIQHGPNKGKYEFTDGDWEEDRYDSFITVFAGHLQNKPEQGVVEVNYWPHYQSIQISYFFQSPAQDGDLRITGAVGERLILSSSQGATLYFDVTALAFVESLAAPAPTPISAPTRVPPSSSTSVDDAPDLPFEADQYQSQNEELSFTINSPTDRDWLHFYSRKPGTITVSLVRLAGDYGLRVVRLIDDPTGGEIVGEDTTPRQGKKEVVLPDAPPGITWCGCGAWTDPMILTNPTCSVSTPPYPRRSPPSSNV